MVESKFLLSGKVFWTFIRTKKYLSGQKIFIRTFSSLILPLCRNKADYELKSALSV